MTTATWSVTAEMVKEAKERIDWLDLARQWNTCQAVISDRQMQFRIMVEYTKQRGLERFKFMDLCAGSGGQAEALLQAFPEAEATVFEFNPLFREMARHHVGRLTDRLTIVGKDLRDPEWHADLEGGYDLIVSADAVGAQPAETLLNIYKGIRHLLKDGGTFLNANYVRCDDEQMQAMFRAIKQARHTEDNARDWKRFWQAVDDGLGVENYASVWLRELSEPGDAGIDGRTMAEQRELLLEAGFSQAFSLWQSYGDRVYAAISNTTPERNRRADSDQ